MTDNKCDIMETAILCAVILIGIAVMVFHWS